MQVRLSALVATKALLEHLGVKHGDWPAAEALESSIQVKSVQSSLIPPICLNRYFSVEAVRQARACALGRSSWVD
jgi:hypothetical protein